MSRRWRWSSRRRRASTRPVASSGACACSPKNASSRSLAPVEHDREVGVAGRPRVFETGGRARLEERVDLVSEPVDRLAKRRAPALVPVGAGRAAAVAPPALDPVGAAPRRSLANLDLVGGRVRREERAVVGEGRGLAGLDLLDGGGERHLAEALVVTVRLAVGRAVDQLRPGALVGEGRLEPGDDVLGAVEEALERDRARDRTVVEEDRQG